MEYMTSAARAASPRTSASGAAPQTAGTSPGQLSAFLLEAERRRDRHSREAGQRPADWADSDPHAALRLPAGAHPVNRAVRRHREGASRTNFRDGLRRACAVLEGVAPRMVTDGDVWTYPWHHLDADAAAEFRQEVYARYHRQSTRNDFVSKVRRVVIQCCKAGLISPLRRDAVLDELYTIAVGPSTRRRRIGPTELASLLATTEQHGSPRAAARDTAMIALLWTTGMRTCELVYLDLDDWDRASGALLLRDTKNGRDHEVYLHTDAEPYLRRWVTLRGDAPGPLFVSTVRRDLHRMTPGGVRYLMGRRREQAGLAPFGCHDFRRTFATQLLRTHDPVLVGKLLNHSKLSSTMIYDLSAEEEQRDAVGRLSLPPLDTDARMSTDAPERRGR